MIGLKGTADTRELQAFGDTLRQYMKTTSKTDQEVLDRKGNDLRIQLGKLYQRQRWKGGKTIAEREGRRRAKMGKGTLVRSKQILDRYKNQVPTYQKRKASSRKTRGALVNGVRQKGTYKSGTYSALVKTTKWQKLVWQEWARRQAGIGVLAVAFFAKRFRYKKGVRYVEANKSKSLGELVRITKTQNTFRITGFTPGQETVANRYGIVNQAVRNVRADMETYLLRKYSAPLRSYLNRVGGQRGK